ncbi:hypothetical protein KCV01_g6719, partial [Aureobasidium melanogenum]
MAKPEYQPPLAALLRKLLGSWDGNRPKGSQAGTDQLITGPLVKDPADAKTSVTLVLLPSEEVPNGWDHDVRQSLTALSASASTPIEVGIQIDDDGAGTCGDQYRKALILQAPRRIMAWNSIDPRLGQQLIEHDIPLYGVFYLVCAPTDWARTDLWLRREQISFEAMEVIGLPSGWHMACIQRAERLTAEHRQYLADVSEATDVPPARLQLVGGGWLLRGGARLFASYDLPAIEFEGPPEAFLEAPGLQLSEVPQHRAKEGQSGIRRFLVDLLDVNCRSFDISLLAGRVKLASTRLRVADPGGEGRGVAKDFSLDPLGFPASITAGLQGNRIGGAQQDSASEVWHSEQMLEVPDIVTWAGKSFADSGAAQFLDTLAARGSIFCGEARDQISRLSGGSNPISLLMDLRARGCLEIETDGKGHFVRIHSVAPSLYGLPATQDGLPLFGVSGTLRLAQWTLLQANENFMVAAADPMPGHLPALRVAAIDGHSVQAACSLMGFLFAPCPARGLALWAGTLRQAREAAESLGTETVSAELGHLHRLKADSARFVPVGEPRMSIDRECGAQLFRFNDPQATAMQLYVLGVRRADGTSRYSHVPDSRWGVWISQLAFAEMLKEKHGRDDAFPWPLHYDAGSRDLWVPARLRPPAVLERALVLCSGNGPAIHFLSSAGDADDRAPVLDGYAGRVVGAISHVYREFVPGPWLRYSWVPKEIAKKVAALLGCALEPFACSAFRTDSPSFEDDREKLLKIPGVLFQEPYLELLPSYVNGKALSSLDGMDLPGLDEAARQGFIALAGAGLMPAGADLYVHQQRMLRAAMQRKHCVVVTGTGSGKTESFLLPVFASIAREALRPSGGWAAAAPPATLPSEWKSAPQWSFGRAAARSEQRKPAVRALLLYPMNALVEDQMSRLRRALDSDDAHAALDLHWGANRVRFGRYNGTTPVPGHPWRLDGQGQRELNKPKHDELKAALKQAIDQYQQLATAIQAAQDRLRSLDTADGDTRDTKQQLAGLREQLSFVPRMSPNAAEMFHRWEMQAAPPDLLITNVSMLSIMLMRQASNAIAGDRADGEIFEATREWLAEDRDNHVFQLVLDELHLYRGASGTEVGYLLRLLLERLGLDPGSNQLQILASSASLDGEAESTYKFLGEFFGMGQEAARDRFHVEGGASVNGDPKGSVEIPPSPLIY